MLLYPICKIRHDVGGDDQVWIIQVSRTADGKERAYHVLTSVVLVGM